MAQKRMLSIQIIESYPFLSMPLTSQALYMHLVLNCDDDGIVEAYKVMMIVQAKPDDLQILVAKRFCDWLDETRMIMFICDWVQQNKIRADRYNPSIYKSLLFDKYPNYIQVQEKQKRIMSTYSEQCQTFLSDKKTDTGQVSIDQINIEQQQSRRTRISQMMVFVKMLILWITHKITMMMLLFFVKNVI